MLKKSLKILTVVGARPQFVKAAVISRAVTAHNRANPSRKIVEDIVHTGQHYDDRMSRVFFRELGIPKPKADLKFFIAQSVRMMI